MTKYVIVSDSHYNQEVLEELVTYYPNYMILHCGDSELSDNSDIFKNIITVCGNCDVESEIKPLERIINNDKDSFFICHGHLYNVKQHLLSLQLKAKELGVNIALFGHTHLPYCSYDSVADLLIINPGSIELPRTYPSQKTYVFLETDDTQYIVQFMNENHECIETYTYQRK